MNHVEKLRKKLDGLTISDYHGLNSPGLTCYLNSVLQVLFMTEGFREAVQKCCGNNTTSIDPHLSRLFTELQRNTAKTHIITEKLGITNVYEQRDAAEYFEKILCLTSSSAAKMFRGELNHRTQCLRCNETTDSRSFFWILPLAVEYSCRKTYSVEKGLKAFFKGERFCGDNKMYCNQCEKKREADFGCEMTLHPEILTLLLKRFCFDYERRCYVKLRCKVDVPQTLHVEDCKYALYAVVDHFGNLTGGHYTALINSFETQVWYRFNDNIVTGGRQPLFGAGDAPLRSSTAYLLMYRKVSRQPEITEEGDHEAQVFTHSDLEAKGRHGEAEGGSRHQLKDEHCSGGEIYKHLNGDFLEKHLPTQKTLSTKAQKGHGQKSQEPNGPQLDTNSVEPLCLFDTRGNPTERLTTYQVDYMYVKKRPKAKEMEWETQNNVLYSHLHNKPAGTKVVTNEMEAAAAEVRIEEQYKHMRKAGVSANVCLLDAKSCHVSSSGGSFSLVPRTQNQMRGANKQIGRRFSPNVNRKKSNDSETVQEKTKHVVLADDTKHTMTRGGHTASPRGKRKAAESKDSVPKEPWR